MFPYKFESKDLNNLSLKKQYELMRIAMGKDGRKILTPEQWKKAQELISSRRGL